MFDWTYLPTIVTVTVLQCLAVASPGPDFALVSRNSILHSRRIGIATGLGISTGIALHLVYLVAGFGLVVASLTKFLFVLKIAGAIYLFYLGVKSLRSAGKIQVQEDFSVAIPPVSVHAAFVSGMFTNLLNPKAILFLISLFTVVLDQETPLSILLTCGVIIVVTTTLWFSFVAWAFSGRLRVVFLRGASWVDRATGGFLLFVGTKIGLTCFE